MSEPLKYSYSFVICPKTNQLIDVSNCCVLFEGEDDQVIYCGYRGARVPLTESPKCLDASTTRIFLGQKCGGARAVAVGE